MANPSAFSYSFANTVLTLNGIRIGAFDEGDSVIKITPSADLVTVTTGVDGSKTYNISADRGWIMEITLQKLSPSNSVLRQIANSYQVPGIPVLGLSCLMLDVVARDRFVGTAGMITKVPGPEKGGRAGKQTWTLEFSGGEVTESAALELGAV
jgi:hypothetical protein